MHRTASALVLSQSLVLLAGAAVGQPGILTPPAPEPPAVYAMRPTIQVAICLDTSGSMEGLINQARSRLWAIVNHLARARHGGAAPVLEVAVFQYGSDHQSSSENFAACVLPFTSDLDAVSEALFSLAVGGSAEYCGAVVQAAARHVTWTAEGPGSLRVMIVAGNEEFTQGPVNYRDSVPDAKERGITVNTIYCGRDEEGQATGWLHAAHLAGGDYAVIEQDRVLVEIPCPQDERLRDLNAQLNGTYLYYGAGGRNSAERQVAQDGAAAEAAPSAYFGRALSKANAANYNASEWDLVDLYEQEGEAGVLGVERSTLPEEAARLDDAALLARIGELQSERSRVREEIQRLSVEREAWLSAELERRGEDTGGSLDDAVIAAVTRQAVEAGFVFEK
jgi:hypothetical protein